MCFSLKRINTNRSTLLLVFYFFYTVLKLLDRHILLILSLLSQLKVRELGDSVRELGNCHEGIGKKNEKNGIKSERIGKM